MTKNKKNERLKSSKILKSSEVVVHSNSTDYLFWKIQKTPPKLSQLLRSAA